MKHLMLFESFTNNKLTQLFNNLNDIIKINFYQKSPNKIEFTYNQKFNSWSHSLSLILEEEKIFLSTYRISDDKIEETDKEELNKCIKSTFQYDKTYKIPIEKLDLIEKVLTKYDRFKKIGNFNRLFFKTGIKKEQSNDIEIDNINTGASILSNGKFVLSSDFGNRKKYEYTDNELKQIENLPLIKYQDISDIDDPKKHNWYVIGDDKYNRYMYDPISNIKRTQTMGEFYGDSVVD